MFFVLTERVVKGTTGTTKKFEPRTTNYTHWHVAGPFTSRKLAERTASTALGTHTCLNAEVYDSDELERIKSASSFEQISYQKRDAVIQFLICHTSLSRVGL